MLKRIPMSIPYIIQSLFVWGMVCGSVSITVPKKIMVPEMIMLYNASETVLPEKRETSVVVVSADAANAKKRLSRRIFLIMRNPAIARRGVSIGLPTHQETLANPTSPIANAPNAAGLKRWLL